MSSKSNKQHIMQESVSQVLFRAQVGVEWHLHWTLGPAKRFV